MNKENKEAFVQKNSAQEVNNDVLESIAGGKKYQGLGEGYCKNCRCWSTDLVNGICSACRN